ncbi:MAG: hypothetical protein ACOY3I_01710 [Verrucomicrobiota bacterium]
MNRLVIVFFTAGLLAACSTPTIKNVDSNFYAHNLSSKMIPVAFEERVEATKKSPTYYYFVVQKNILHEGELIIPKGSALSCVLYYPDNPKYLVVHALKLSGNVSWTPAQGIVTVTMGEEGYATLSHVTIPQ